MSLDGVMTLGSKWEHPPPHTLTPPPTRCTAICKAMDAIEILSVILSDLRSLTLACTQWQWDWYCSTTIFKLTPSCTVWHPKGPVLQQKLGRRCSATPVDLFPPRRRCTLELFVKNWTLSQGWLIPWSQAALLSTACVGGLLFLPGNEGTKLLHHLALRDSGLAWVLAAKIQDRKGEKEDLPLPTVCGEVVCTTAPPCQTGSKRNNKHLPATTPGVCLPPRVYFHVGRT